MKGQLSVVTDRGIIEEKKVFQVTVINQDNKPVEGAFVYITSRVTPEITNQQGLASIRAPDVEKTASALTVMRVAWFMRVLSDGLVLF